MIRFLTHHPIKVNGQWQRNLLDQSAAVKKCVATIENAIRYKNPYDPTHGEVGDKMKGVLIEDFTLK
jgi:hypothetical protein